MSEGQPSTPSAQSLAEDKLHPMAFYDYAKNCAAKLVTSGCYPQPMLQEFSGLYTKKPLQWRNLETYNLFRDVIGSFCGKLDEFYPQFYKAVNLSADRSPFLLTKKSHLVVGYDLANYVLAHLSKGKFINGSIVFPETKASLSERSKSIIIYLGGYVNVNSV